MGAVMDEEIRKFQTARGLTRDGIAGHQTIGELLRLLRAGELQYPAETEVLAGPGWDARSERNLKGVHADLVRVMNLARQRSPVRFVVIEGLRTEERQRQLVAQGASKTMNSRHLTGHAVDLVPLGPTGQPAFDWPLYYKLAPVVKAAAEELGVALDWGGDWRSFKDGPHFELRRSVYP